MPSPKNKKEVRKEEIKLNKEGLKKMFQVWRDTDMVKAGYNYSIIEAKNEAFVRGYRLALYSVIRKIEDNL